VTETYVDETQNIWNTDKINKLIFNEVHVHEPGSLVEPSKTEVHVNDVQKLIPYITKDTLHLHYKNVLAHSLM
jgi:hypothetical protein